MGLLDLLCAACFQEGPVTGLLVRAAVFCQLFVGK